MPEFILTFQIYSGTRLLRLKNTVKFGIYFKFSIETVCISIIGFYCIEESFYRKITSIIVKRGGEIYKTSQDVLFSKYQTHM